jgi:hypothetical protein
VPDVHAITSAGRSHTDQLKDRTRNYLISMGIRTAAFVAAFFTDGWVRWTCVGLAFVLPYIAVLMANSGTEKRTVPSSYLDDHALEAGPAADDGRHAGLRRDDAAPQGPTGHTGRVYEPDRAEPPR